MITKVVMPQLGESVVEGTVSHWLIKVGERVQEYDALLEVSTDKVDTEVSAPATGTLLHIYVDEGATVEAGTVLAVIGEPGDEIPGLEDGNSTQSKATRATAQPVGAVTASSNNGSTNGHTSSTQQPLRISPVVARMAAEHNLDLQQINGTGRGGRVTKKDVEAYLSQRSGAVQNVPAPATNYDDLPPWERPGDGDLFKPTGDFQQQAATPLPMSSPAPAPVIPKAASIEPTQPAPQRAMPVEPIPQGSPGETVALSRMRKAIADHMVRSKLETSPHVTTLVEIDMTNVMTHRSLYKADFEKRGVNLTITAYFVAAMVAACQAQPTLNSQWTDDGIYIHHAVNIGMAVAIDDGLIVPVIHHAEQLNLLGLAQRVNDLAHRARNRQLKPDEIQGGTISLTNHGVSGSLLATPIINQPQAAIFGVGMIEKRVKVINDAIAIRPCCYATLTFDHRIADGAIADGWLMAAKQTLENWSTE